MSNQQLYMLSSYSCGVWERCKPPPRGARGTALGIFLILTLLHCLKSLFQHYQGSYRLSKKCSRTFQDFLSTKIYFPGLMAEFHIVFHDKEIHKTFRRKRYQAELILNLMQIFYKFCTKFKIINNNFLIEILHYMVEENFEF